MAELSIVATLKETVSSGLKSMSSATKAFNKDAEDLQIKLKTLDRRQDDLADSMDACRKKVKEYRKEFEETGSALSKMKLDDARDTLRGYSRELGEVRRETRETEKALHAMNETAGKSGESKILSRLKDTTQDLARAGYVQLVAQAAGELGGAYVSSALGDDVGNATNSILSGIISGAAMGSFGGLGIGTVIGGIAGGISGAISAEAKKFTKQDDYFKAYYNGIIDQQAEKRASDIQAGSGIAARRETDKVSFTTLFGNEEVAGNYLKDLVGMANTTPFLYDDLTAMSKTLATYGYGADDILPVLTKIGDAGAALGMSTSDMNMVATALGRMKSSNKATLEYLNILNDRGIGAVQMLADKKGMSVGGI